MDFLAAFSGLGIAVILGALVGSFTNVLIHRIPRNESIAFPPSHCPKCDHQLGVMDLIPVLSWLGLGGKCRYCKNPINPRYPIIETISALGYFAIASKYPLLDSPVATVGLWALFTMLLAGAAIDIETKTLPDVFTLGMVALGIAVAALGAQGPGLMNLNGAIFGALIGAGSLAMIRGLGNWVLRRLSEPKFPSYPIDDTHIHLAALAAFWFGPMVGAAVALLSVLLNFILKRVLLIPDFITLGGLFLSAIFLGITNIPNLGPKLIYMLLGAGAISLLGGLYWAIAEARQPQIQDETEAETEDYDPQAMGFGDVKLLAGIGAFFGWQGALFALVVSVFIGAIVGLLGRVMGGEREIPFGPYIAIGALVALFTASAPLLDYLRNLGL